MLPEWLWIILVGGMMVGLGKALWGSRNQGFLSTEKHIEFCGKVKEEVCMDIDKISASLNEGLKLHSHNIQMLLNAKFESLDDKIENKVLRELRLISNGNGCNKRQIVRKKK